MKEFGNSGYQTTQEELDNNLIGIGAIKMLKLSKMTTKCIVKL